MYIIETTGPILTLSSTIGHNMDTVTPWQAHGQQNMAANS